MGVRLCGRVCGIPTPQGDEEASNGANVNDQVTQAIIVDEAAAMDEAAKEEDEAAEDEEATEEDERIAGISRVFHTVDGK